MSDPPRPTPLRPSADKPFGVHLNLPRGRLTLTGRLTRSTTHLLHEAVSAMLAVGGETWVIDVAGADLGGGTGVQALGGVYRRLLRHGRRMTVAGADASLHQQLARLRLDHHVLPGVPLPSSDS